MKSTAGVPLMELMEDDTCYKPKFYGQSNFIFELSGACDKVLNNKPKQR
jgi:hypothetical protein